MPEDIIYNIGKAVNDAVRTVYGMATAPKSMSAMAIHPLQAESGAVTFNQDTATTSRRAPQYEAALNVSAYGFKFM